MTGTKQDYPADEVGVCPRLGSIHQKAAKKFVYNGCGALRRLAVCGKNDATCRTMPQRNASGVNEPRGA